MNWEGKAGWARKKEKREGTKNLGTKRKGREF